MPGAPVTGPTFPIGRIDTALVEIPAGVGLDVVHDAFGHRIRRDNHVHVIRADMRGYKIPPALAAPFNDRCQYRMPARLVQTVRVLIHKAAFREGAAEIWFEHRTSRSIMIAVDRPGVVPVKACAVAGESYEVCIRGLRVDAGAGPLP